MTYTNLVLDYLKTHKGITSMEAFKLFGNTRLSATIYQLRQQGYKIVAKDKEVKTRYGRKTYVAEYSLVK